MTSRCRPPAQHTIKGRRLAQTPCALRALHVWIDTKIVCQLTQTTSSRRRDLRPWFCQALESVAELKGRLLKGAAGVNRGLNCREGEQKEFIDIIEQLEVGRRGGVGTQSCCYVPPSSPFAGRSAPPAACRVVCVCERSSLSPLRIGRVYSCAPGPLSTGCCSVKVGVASIPRRRSF